MSAFALPPLPPELMQALMRQQGAGMPGAPAGGIPPGTIPKPAVVPQSAAVSPPPGQTPAPVTQPSGARPTPVAPGAPKPPPPTDDPTAIGMGPPPGKPPDVMSYLNPMLADRTRLMQERQAADERTRIDPMAVKPRLWERLVGIGLGATQLGGDAKGVASEVTHRRLNSAEAQRNFALSPIDQQLAALDKGAPLAEAASRGALGQGELNLKTATENRERFSAQSNAQYKSDIADIREQVAQGNIEKAQNQLDQAQKVLEQKKTHDQEWFQNQQELLAIRQELADQKANKNTRGTPNQFRGAEDKKAAALAKAEDEFQQATKEIHLDRSHKPDDELYNQDKAEYDNQVRVLEGKKRAAQDAYLADVRTLGGESEGATKPETQPNAPGAQPSGSSGQPTLSPANVPNQAPASKPSLPTEVGPAGEKPLKIGKGDADGKQYGYFASTRQWMLLPQMPTGTLLTGGAK